MQWRRRLADGAQCGVVAAAIVTAGAVVGDANVHEVCWSKRRIGVADLAILGGWQMPCGFDEPWVVGE